MIAKVFAPANRRIQAIQALSHPRSMTMNTGHQSDAGYQSGTNGYIHQKAVVHHSGGRQATSEMEPRSHSANEPRTVNASAQATSQSQTHLVSTATGTDDLPQDGQGGPGGMRPRSQRPKSLMAIDSDKSRDRSHRSMEGRRRSLERMQCVDLTDASPPTPARNGKDQSMQTTQSNLNGPSAAILDEYERELRRRLLHQGTGDSTTKDEVQLDQFESLLKESMDDVAILMREVQNELSLIRAEERRFQSQSTQSLHRLSSASLNNPHRSQLFDTLSIDGQLPFLPSFATSLSAYHNAYQSWDRGLGGYFTSSEISDDDRASLTTAVSDDVDINTKSSF